MANNNLSLIEAAAHIAEEQSDAMGVLFRTIARLTTDRDVIGLCEHGATLADLQGNDIGVLREQALTAD